jgi:hypothetical protein
MKFSEGLFVGLEKDSGEFKETVSVRPYQIGLSVVPFDRSMSVHTLYLTPDFKIFMYRRGGDPYYVLYTALLIS